VKLSYYWTLKRRFNVVLQETALSQPAFHGFCFILLQ